MLRKWAMVWMACLTLAGLAGVADAAYVDNANGTVTDTGTGLMWQKATAPGTYTQQQANRYCEDLVLGGRSDWRLPTIDELTSILDLNHNGLTINTAYFPDTVGAEYWSSTTHTYDDCVSMELIDFQDGCHHIIEIENGVVLPPSYFNFYVRAVRTNGPGSFGLIAMSPMSGPPGTTFTEWGTGFTPNTTATLHFKKPDGTEYPTLSQRIDAIGHFEITYTAPYNLNVK
ncbi:MAG: DUF1566 domain-containing protein [Desulfosalsimonadaceae bacterium]